MPDDRTLVSITAISRERSVPNTQNENLGDSLPYLNAVVTPETVCLAIVHLPKINTFGSLCQLMIMLPNYVLK